jgi:hypothetical protein
MSSRNRKTLKNYFSDGQLPTQEHFADLIDSMLNMSDEGFFKTVEDGEKIHAAVSHDALLSFYRDEAPDQLLWRVGLGGVKENRLQIMPNPDAAPLLSLDRAQRVGIGRSDPSETLDVAGTVAMTGRLGRCIEGRSTAPLLANGDWQNLLTGLHGCQGFELMAGAGLRGSGHFSMLHAIALSAFGPRSGPLAWLGRRRGIRSTQAWWGQRCDRLELRWFADPKEDKDGLYRLQIRTGCDFGRDQLIQAHITRLWFDPEMAQCQRKPGGQA